MSGGPVVDSSGNVVGLVVNGNREIAGVVSIEKCIGDLFFQNRRIDGISGFAIEPYQNSSLFEKYALIA